MNTDSFLFFRALEIIVQESLHNHLLSRQADKQDYISTILRNEEIHLLWSKLSTDIDTNSSEELLATIIEKWVTLCGFAQVETVKKKKALRKDLAAKNDDDQKRKQKGKRKLLVREEVMSPRVRKLKMVVRKLRYDEYFSGS